MNAPAKVVLGILGFVLVLFALAMVLFPVFGIVLPEQIGKSFEALTVAFVGMLATLGRTEPPENRR